MLVKTFADVFIPAVPAQPYRPYSKTCPTPPPPPHTPRWVTKQVCGTVSTFVFFAYITPTSYGEVTQTVYNIPGMALVIVNSSTYITDLPFTEPTLAAEGPYCVTVRVYE